MMNSKKIHSRILWTTICLCAFIYMDIFFIPSKSEKEIVTKMSKSVRKNRKYGGTRYKLETNATDYGICPQLYENLHVGETVFINKSALTNSYRKIELKNGNRPVTCDISFMQDSGIIYLSFITVLTLLFIFFYEKVTYVPGRKHLTFYLAVSGLILLVLHILN